MATKRRSPGGSSRKGPSGPRRKRSGSGKGGRRTVIIAVLATVAVGLGLVVLFGDKLFRPVGPSAPAVKPHTEITLYVSDAEGLYLNGVPRLLAAGPVEVQIREALKLLIRDSSGAVPEGTRLRGVSVRGTTAFVDFSRELIDNHPGGTSGELITVYSIVNTVALNFRGVKGVQILVDGKKVPTLAGHIDIKTPVPPDRKIIRAPEPSGGANGKDSV